MQKDDAKKINPTPIQTKNHRKEMKPVTPKQKLQQSNLHDLETKQREKMAEIINLESGKSTNIEYQINYDTDDKRTQDHIIQGEINAENTQEDHEVFQTVRRRKRTKIGNGEGDENLHGRDENGSQYQRRNRYMRNRGTGFKKALGTGEEEDEVDSSGFSGIEKKVWLYIYRCKSSCKAEDIKGYISRKPGFEKIIVGVNELVTGDSKNKCFVVSGPFQKKEEMYRPNFWPRNVGFKRFDFKKFKEYNQGDFL